MAGISDQSHSALAKALLLPIGCEPPPIFFVSILLLYTNRKCSVIFFWGGGEEKKLEMLKKANNYENTQEQYPKNLSYCPLKSLCGCVRGRREQGRNAQIQRNLVCFPLIYIVKGLTFWVWRQSGRKQWARTGHKDEAVLDRKAWNLAGFWCLQLVGPVGHTLYSTAFFPILSTVSLAPLHVRIFTPGSSSSLRGREFGRLPESLADIQVPIRLSGHAA